MSHFGRRRQPDTPEEKKQFWIFFAVMFVVVPVVINIIRIIFFGD